MRSSLLMLNLKQDFYDGKFSVYRGVMVWMAEMLFEGEQFVNISRFDCMSIITESEFKGHSDFPMYCFVQYVYSSRYMALSLLQLVLR